MELADVRAFVRVADKGSVSAAAQGLHITQSAVTKRLQRLESYLGTTLLDRTQRPVALTKSGQRALERCRRLLNDMNDLRVAVSSGNSELGELRLGVAHALGELALTEPVGILRQEFPRLGLKLVTGWSLDLLERVRSGALDAALVLLPDSDRLPSEVIGTAIGKERLVILGSRSLRSGTIRGIRDLNGVQWILCPDGCNARATLRKVLERAGVDMQVAIESYSYELQLLLASEGRGLTLVPERVWRTSSFRSRLRALTIAGLHFPLNIWSLQRTSAELEPAFSVLTRLLLARLQRATGIAIRHTSPPRSRVPDGKSAYLRSRV